MASKKVVTDLDFGLNAGLTDATHLTIHMHADEVGLRLVAYDDAASSEIIGLYQSDNSTPLIKIYSAQSTSGFMEIHGNVILNESTLDIIGAIFKSNSAQTQNLTEWRNSGGAVLAKVTPQLQMVASGFDASSASIINVSDPTNQTDGVNYQSCLREVGIGISGTMPYWERDFVDVVIATVSGLILESDAVDSAPYDLPILRNCLITHIGVNTEHLNGSDPGPWDIQIVRNDESTAAATFQFGFASTNLTDFVSASGLQTPVTLSPGDRIAVLASGGANVITGGIVIRVTLGFTLLEANPI